MCEGNRDTNIGILVQRLSMERVYCELEELARLPVYQISVAPGECRPNYGELRVKVISLFPDPLRRSLAEQRLHEICCRQVRTC